MLRQLLLDVSSLETLPVPKGLLRQTLIDLDAQSGQRRQRLGRAPSPNQRGGDDASGPQGRDVLGGAPSLVTTGLIKRDVNPALNTPLTVVVGLTVAPQNEIRHDAVVSRPPKESPSWLPSCARSAGSSMAGQSFHRRSSE